ncbi:MAG: hypothetical protein ACOYON_06000 [Fimbriimonas sp.]
MKPHLTLDPARQSWARIRKHIGLVLLTTLVLIPDFLLVENWRHDLPSFDRALCLGLLGGATSFAYLAILARFLFGSTIELRKPIVAAYVAHSTMSGAWWAFCQQVEMVEAWYFLNVWIIALEFLALPFAYWRPLVLLGQETPIPAVRRSLSEFRKSGLNLVLNQWLVPLLLLLLIAFSMAFDLLPAQYTVPFTFALTAIIVPFQEVVLLVIYQQKFTAQKPEPATN